MPHKKILFRLDRDADGYPPSDVEGVWADEVSDGVFVIDNIPFYATQVALGDMVDADQVNNELFYRSTKSQSPNSLVRVVMFGGGDPSPLRDKLASLGCSTELSNVPSLFAVSVPATVPIDRVREILDEGCAEGVCDYEEPVLRQ